MNSLYKNKYIKYKRKYLDLKKALEYESKEIILDTYAIKVNKEIVSNKIINYEYSFGCGYTKWNSRLECIYSIRCN